MTRTTHPSFVDRAIPGLFVLIWSTGFIIARLIATHADPFTFLAVRFSLTTVAFLVIALATRAAWPRTVGGWRNAVISGVLIQAVYTACVFWAVRRGLPTGMSALIGGLQPVMTAALAWPLLGEPVGARRWLGVALGFAGVALVVWPKLGLVAGIPPVPLLATFVGVVGITLGTLWQKSVSQGIDLRTNATIQFLGAAVVMIPLALATEGLHFDFSPHLLGALLWSSLINSVGAVSLLLLLIKRGAVAGVTSLFYLVPPVTAVIAFVLFSEALTWVQIAGMAVAVFGVTLASNRS